MSRTAHDTDKPIDYTLVRRRLILLFIFVVLGVVSLVLFLNYKLTKSIEQNENITELVNISGRQRMLSQNLAKNALLYQRTHDAKLLMRIDSIESNLSANYQRLKDYDFDFQKEAWSNSIGRYFSQVLLLQAPLLDAADGLKGATDKESIDYYVDEILRCERKFLPVMEAFTSRYALIGSGIIRQTKENITEQNYINTFSIVVAATIVLLITLYIIKGYASQLQRSKVALNEVLESEQQKVEKLELLTSSINVGIWEKSISKKTESWSEALYRILGYSAGEIEGTAEEFLKHVHPDDLSQLNEAIQFSIETSIPSTTELRVKTKDGWYKWLEATGNAKRNSAGKLELLIGGLIDIHEKKLLAIQLNAFVDRSPAAIAMFDLNMDFMFVSQRWVEDYHTNWRQLVGYNFYEVYAENARIWRPIHEDCLRDGIVSSGKEDPITIKDGSVSWIKWEVRPWYISKEEIGGLLMFTTDVTENRQKLIELNNAKRAAEAASKAKETFLTTMSHEIRTPITAIAGVTQILLSENPRKDQKEHLDLLKFSGDNLLNLINDILDLSKIDAGKMEIEEVPFDFQYLLNNIKNALNYKAKEKGIDFILSYDERLPNVLIGDVTRLSQVIFNLAGNALKFTEKGQVSIKTTFLAEKNNQVKFRVSVKDTGIGVPKDKWNTIFKSFEQADSGVTRNYGGTGMGLYITKKILMLMGSKIKLESTPGKGSEFYFDLKLAIGSMDLSIESQDFNWPAHFKGNSYRVLIAEDSESNQYLIKNYLEKVNIAFDIAMNGEQAIKMIGDKEYHIVFMDLQMPVMDGYTAAIKIRKMEGEYFKQIPIIALTADAFSNVKDVTVSAGMTGYISKPFKPSEMYSAIDKNATKPIYQETDYLNLVAALTDHCDGDREFIEEFSGICTRSYSELSQELKLSFKSKDHQRLKNILHKIKPLNEMLHLHKLNTVLANIEERPFEQSIDNQMIEIDKIIKYLGNIGHGE
ncbi:MAG: ATP-binding protein [Cyclobacteriaceae bacterium]